MEADDDEGYYKNELAKEERAKYYRAKREAQLLEETNNSKTMTEEEKRAKENAEAVFGKAPELDLSKIKNLRASAEKSVASKDFVEKTIEIGLEVL